MASSTTTSAPTKISMFGAKSGFVIPKNKLSGSLIPIFQRGGGGGAAGKDNGTVTKLGKRKSKWGPDLTQDVAVKKSRVLAYQKRLDQIREQLESGTHEAESNGETKGDIAEHLELEKREAIGEILELNPRFKAPPDYKPLMKEARLPIDVKEHSDFSFLSLIFGSQGDTLKQLEKETGAKVQVFGTKPGGEKVELSPSDENEIQTSWEELHFQISSETYEKVDAAIAVIELLISSVSESKRAEAAPPSSKSEDVSTVPGNINATATDPNSEQPTETSVQPPQTQLEEPGSSIPLASHQVPFHPPLNPSAASLGNHIPDQEQPTNPLFAQQPIPIHHNTSLRSDFQVPRPPDLFSFNLSSTPRPYSVVPPQGSLVQQQSGFSTAPPYSVSQAQSTGPRSTMRPSTLSTFQPVPSSGFRPTLLPDIISNNMSQSVRHLAPNLSLHPGTEIPSGPFPSSINLKHLTEYASGGSLRPMSMSAHTAGRPSAPRPFHGDFGFHPQPLISPRPNSQSVLLPPIVFRAPSVSPASQHFGQSFTRSQHFGRQMDQPLSHLPGPFHGNMRSSNLQNFGPPLPQVMPRNFPEAQFPQRSAHFPPRPVFHNDNLNPSGQPQIRHRFNPGVHQVYDPFSPSDA
ncbi:unnamed protein product [Eruca vesicaria subsp. sativa]|uniref:K Homology domain-containing protein n=1 Tax=Eruca vesicaria subsp. sativa TaxID=29727 RepID=A0ABC8L4S7_ERUVS|nr:unnamed protein product [Eruca vesicaria subsp. sativa]